MKLGEIRHQPRHLINGRWVSGATTGISVNPSDTREVVAEFARADRNQTELAIAAAADALPQWSLSTPQRRADALDLAGSELLARKDELGELLAREEGKTLPEAIAEVARAGNIFKFFAGEALRIGGETLASVRPGVQVDITREPVGVVAVIAPWNFPFAIPAWKIAPALAYGNTVVFKPADLVPGSSWAIVEMLNRNGLPKGVLNLVMGKGSVVGQTMLDSKDIVAQTFTGSVNTGRRVAEASVKVMRKFQLEMGGKNPTIVLDDADLKVAVETVAQSAFFSTGQRCTATSRVIVTEGIHDAFVDALCERTKNLRVGDALTKDTEIGPVVDAGQLKQDMDYIDIGQSEGAKLRVGGQRLNREAEGFYLQPALFTEVHNNMRIAREEIFGPVAAVIRVKDYEEALAVANDTEFGLSAGIVTTSLKYATHFKRNAEAGMVMVNVPTAGVDFHVPFGGRKGSSYGPKEQGKYAAEFFTQVKTAYTAAG